MADRLDLLISDYMTGMLQVKINAREKWITRQTHTERIGSSGSSSNTAPQERRLLIIEEDKGLQLLTDQKKTLDELMEVIQGTTVKDIIIARFKYRLSWDKVGVRVSMEESTARKQYATFKSTLRDGLWQSTLD
ncbi:MULTISPECIES: DUF722 domain-containing protein [unclassified Lactococcus]|uniref:DUF722 domain-containing protein n=1 Tax=unclassified Lactococcus TaxID=2643510 RepID=UPI0011CC90FC|nr:MULTISPECIES: DUF722 domain-containing protein [unclassified Lactococcus]MQW22955.1 DUF722 domain-containing protein [Lactococcus sp. dk101]TXK44499.1 DUF722 domain-containing protein [Lactococcus sp. dk310]TXK50352.1 DUF722 domain-containing protein [Lactococcus sp. dk322]